eukprot:jgi/Bigna1/49856/estExt_Genewise1.C_580056
MQYESDASEKFFGFGEQYSVWNAKGLKIPILTQEQGVGRGLEPITILADMNIKGAGGSWHTTYSAIPHYVTNRHRSLHLDTGLYSVFDLSQDRSVEITVARGDDITNAASGSSSSSSSSSLFGFSGGIVYGSSYNDVLLHYTDVIGRMGASMPQWAVCGGAILGLEGGTSAVRSMWKEMKDAQTPIAGLWIQDWSGKVRDSFGERVLWNWDLDKELYDGWNELVLDLKDDGARMLTYINPYLTNNFPPSQTTRRRNLFSEAEELGYLVLNSSGQPYLQHCGAKTFSFGTVDLTNDQAAKWYAEEVIGKLMLQNSNTSGWMADFGEYLPFDAASLGGGGGGGKSGYLEHNRFPELWARVNQHAIRYMKREGDIVNFHRSSSLMSPKYATLFWSGDQLVTYDEHDGLKSALINIFNAGLSGLSMIHSDIGGYTMMNRCFFGICLNYSRSCDLLMRWSELNAFTDVIYRTHEGSDPAQNEAQVYSSNASKAHFSAYASVHKALCSYRTALIKEASEKGLPVARHPMLHYPQLDHLDTQVMIGPDILMAPVLHHNSNKVANVVLPDIAESNPGEAWIRWPYFHEVAAATAAERSLIIPQQHHQEGSEEVVPEHHLPQVEAPIGVPAVFIKSGMATRYPDTWDELKNQGERVLREAKKGLYDCNRK